MRKIFAIILLFACLSFTHQPRIVTGTGVTEISNPEVSQAFYGELNGTPAYFKIRSGQPFELYVGIVVPAIEGIGKDKSVEVTGNGSRLIFLNSSESEWPYFYEDFGGDGYYSGPDARMNVSPGIYLIEVSGPGNMGKYSLVVGEKESFPLGETVNALVLLPQLKSWFFNKSPLEAFYSRIYLFILIPVIAIACILAILLRWMIRKFRK